MAITDKTRKKLFLKSGNICAFPGCSIKMSDTSQIAHIISSKPNGPRHIEDWNNNDFDVEDNLILLCNNHHNIVDNDVSTYSIEALQNMKKSHEVYMDSLITPSNSLTDKVLFIIEKHNVANIISKVDFTAPFEAESLDRLNECSNQIEELLNTINKNYIEKIEFNDWTTFYTTIQSLINYILPEITQTANPYMLRAKNPNKIRETTIKYREKLAEIYMTYNKFK